MSSVVEDVLCKANSKDESSTEQATSAQLSGWKDRLNVPNRDSILRSLSPDTLSEFSIDDGEAARIGRPLLRRPVAVDRHPSQSPTSPPTIKSRLKAFWIRNKGLALVLLAQFFGTLMNVTTRLLEVEGNNGKGMHPFQILFARMGITVALSSWYMWWRTVEDFPFGKKEVRLLLVARGIFGFFGVFGMYYSLLYLPLADATVITFLAPSLACWACSFLINEPFSRMEKAAAMISLFGVVLIARPTAFFASPKHRSPPASGDIDAGSPATGSRPAFADYDNVTPTQRAMAVAIALVGVLGAAGAYTTIRWVGKRAHALISVNYFATMCTVASLIFMLTLPGVGFLLPKRPIEWAYLSFLGSTGFVMQFLLAAGLQYEKSSRATNVVYTQMLFALAFDKLVFGTTPGVLSILGSSLILGSAIYVALRKEADKTSASETSEGSSDEELGLITDVDGEEEELWEERAPVQEVQLRTMRI